MEYKVYETLYHNRHILIDNGSGRIIIDTGSPCSIHKDGVIELAGKSFEVPTSLTGVDADFLTKNVGCEIVGLLGMDIIDKCQMWINTKAFGNFISFDKPAREFPGWPEVTDFFAINIPGITLEINHRPARMLFDTGAQISYIRKDYLVDAPFVGTAKDFSVLNEGEIYEVEMYSAKTTFRGKEFNVNYAASPKDINLSLDLLGADGIIGFDLIENFRIIVNKGYVWLPPQGI